MAQATLTPADVNELGAVHACAVPSRPHVSIGSSLYHEDS